MNLNPQNLLVISFGQIGDVVMSLPALKAIRKKFTGSRITVLIGKSAKTIVEMSDVADDVIIVDRVKLRDHNKIWSITEIIKLVFKVRKQKFDFVIDLHSLYETNLIGFLSGAKLRLFANRENRSLDFLSNFRPKPPLEDKSLHRADYYLKNLRPLGIEENKHTFRIRPSQTDLEKIKNRLETDKIENSNLVGINLGAGNPSRNWSLDKFAQLTRMFSGDDDLQVLVFCGPEEYHLRNEIKKKFPTEAIIYSDLDLKELAAAFSYLKVLIGNDTGPLHLGTIVGTRIVLVIDKNAPLIYLPLTENSCVVRSKPIDEISVEEVYEATIKLLKDEDKSGDKKASAI